MTWGGARTKLSNFGCLLGLLITLTKGALWNLVIRPRCDRCGKISKLEIVSSSGRVPGVFWLWLALAVIGGTLVLSGFLAFFLNTPRSR